MNSTYASLRELGVPESDLTMLRCLYDGWDWRARQKPLHRVALQGLQRLGKLIHTGEVARGRQA